MIAIFRRNRACPLRTGNSDGSNPEWTMAPADWLDEPVSFQPYFFAAAIAAISYGIYRYYF